MISSVDLRQQQRVMLSRDPHHSNSLEVAVEYVKERPTSVLAEDAISN